jgi:mono/diheme cytochrome c family protein
MIRGSFPQRVLALLVGALGAASFAAFAAAAPDAVTPASGPSLIAKLKTGVDWTAFGRAGEGASGATAVERAPADWLIAGFELTGEDLFRLTCRSCHGPDGRGARSGIPPLQGALVPKEGERGAQIAVRHRLLEGGRIMPSAEHLDAGEVELVLGHLESLARPGSASPAKSVRRPALRVGEHITKANCQICHDAVPGTWRQPADAQVVIPLSTMTERLSAAEFVRKTRRGTAEAGDGGHGRMPRFDYLSERELLAVYVYLVAYPPESGAR